jgi:hypothetical protein
MGKEREQEGEEILKVAHQGKYGIRGVDLLQHLIYRQLSLQT